jgi:ADP-ribose pyrophosphatase
MSNDKPWVTLDATTLLTKPPYVLVVQEKVDTGAGKTIDDFFRVVLPTFAVCVPVTPDNRIVALRQYKHGPGDFSLLFPGGFVEDGEDPRIACLRELREETGYVGAEIRLLGKFVDGGNQQGSTGHYFIVNGCAQIEQPSVPDREPGEMVLMLPDDVEASLRSGDIKIAHHALAWLLARALI